MSTQKEALRNWHAMNRYLRSATEDECWQLLEEEKAGARRLNFLIRIYGRANKYRAVREREALLAPRG